MAFFNKSTGPNSNPVKQNSQTSVQPAAPQNQASVLDFSGNANDTLKQNYKGNFGLNQDVQVQVDPSGLKSITPKLDFAEPKVLAETEVHNEMPSDVLPPLHEVQKSVETTMPTLTQGNPSENLQYANYDLDGILNEAVKAGASDVHLTVGYRANIRVDGELKTFKSSILTPQITYDFCKKLVEKRPDLDLEKLHEADLTYSLGARRFRINIYKQMGLFSIACRIIPERIATLEDLNLPPILKELTKFPNGLVLVTGPTGSGKSTTIASILNNINLTQATHITSIEDPVEYVFPKAVALIDQREFGVDFTSWPNALRSVLRQDPDIVFLGEMRDFDSIEAALQIADTGHLVFATLHTNGAAESVDRIIDVFPADRQAQIRVQLASVLRSIISQRLVALATKGRMPVAEILIANAAVKNAIRDKKTFLIDNVIQTSSDEGMISLEKSLVALVKKGLISINTAKNLSLRPKEIDILLQQ